MISRTLCSAAVVDDNVESAVNLLDKELSFTLGDDVMMVNGVQMTVNDIVASNGIIHVIDTVIVPPEGK